MKARGVSKRALAWIAQIHTPSVARRAETASQARFGEQRRAPPVLKSLSSSPPKGSRMAARILDGNRIRDEIKAELAEKIRELVAAGITPGLAAVLVGSNPASELYVRNKVKTSAA